MTLSAGSKLGPYEILAPLGAGGMGEVYRSRDPRLDREADWVTDMVRKPQGWAWSSCHTREGVVMTTASIDVGEKLYQVKAKFTGVTEFGVSLDALLTGETAPPPEGARFDVAFEGSSSGPRLKGNIVGVDYLQFRADGRIQLHIHAVVTTDDGAKISYFADGVSLPREGMPIADLRESVALTTSSRAYSWVNSLHVWVRGTVNLQTQEIEVEGYAA